MANDLLLRIGLDDRAMKAQLNNLNKTLNTTFSRLGSRMESIGKDLSLRVSAPIGAVGVASVAAFAGFQKLENGLAAITGSSAEAKRQLSSLQKIVADTRTTLDLENASRGALLLQGVGVEAEQAQRTIKALGIATTVSGASADDAGEVFRQLAQSIAKGTVQQEELSVLLERLPALAAIIKNEFGTVAAEGIRAAGVSSAEFTERLTAAIEQSEAFQNVQGGLAKSFEALQGSIRIAGARLGEVIANSLDLENVFSKVSDLVNRVVDGFTGLSPQAQNVAIGLAGVAATIGPLTFAIGAFIKTLPLLKAGLVALTGPLGILGITIGLAAAVFLKYQTAADASAVAQREVNDAMDAANKLIEKENTKVSSLVSVVKSETATKGEKARAIEQLKRISPEYFGQLDVEKVKTDELTGATEKYNSAIQAKIKLQELNSRSLAAQIELEEVNAELADKVPTKRLEAIGKFLASGGQIASQIGELGKRKKELEAVIAQLADQANEEILSGGNQKTKKTSSPTPTPQNEDISKIIESTNKELTAIAGKLALFGGESEAASEKTKVLQSAIEKLLEAGLTPTSGAVQGFVEQLKAIREGVEPLEAIGTGSENIVAATQAAKNETELFNTALSETERLSKAGITKLITKDFEGFKEKIETTVSPLTLLGEAFDNLDAQAAVFGETFNLIGAQITTVQSAISAALADGFSPASAEVEYLTEKLRELNEELKKQEAQQKLVSDGTQAAASAFSSAASSQEKGLKAISKAAKQAARDFIQAQLAQAVAGLAKTLITQFGLVGIPLAIGGAAAVGGLFNAIIPAFAKGGFVDSPTLAVIGERGPEYVLPENKLKGMLSQLQGSAGREGYVAQTYIEMDRLYIELKRVEREMDRIG